MITIGIDIGSTSIKGVLYDVEKGTVLRTESRQLDSRVPSGPGHFEESASRVRELTYDVIRALAKDSPVAAIAFTGQMHGGLLVDRDLNPRTDCITWQDKRGDEVETNGKTLVQNLRGKLANDPAQSIGTHLHTGFLGVSALWLKKHGQFPDSTWKIIGIYDWIASSLVDEEPFTDPGSAAAWGLYSIRDNKWDEQLLASMQIDKKLLPRVLDTGEIAGKIKPSIASELGLPTDCVVVSGAGDTQASYIGSGCKGEQLLLNFGTGSQLMWESANFELYPGTDLRYLSQSKYLHVASTLSGGKSYAVLASFFSDVVQTFADLKLTRDEIYEAMNQLGAEDANGVQFTPYFNGSRTHGEELRASIAGLDSQNFRAANVTRALLEGMIEELAAIYFDVSMGARPHQGIVGSGNGLRRNRALQGVAQKRFGMPIQFSKFEEEAAVGAAILAAKGLARHSF